MNQELQKKREHAEDTYRSNQRQLENHLDELNDEQRGFQRYLDSLGDKIQYTSQNYENPEQDRQSMYHILEEMQDDAQQIIKRAKFMLDEQVEENQLAYTAQIRLYDEEQADEEKNTC
ncbi:hypothetical protein [Enterococcus sp. 5H]|uniref:hypothetical protein n=1 Tax=Enterococcus sp. 5H TaxID=1229490 RepID=UPI00230208F2|nr:hypothetical protein [Enterococcus sp. 5H]MDA9471183.1 hypothetical protein [Enterococcus sp. 5H]